MLRFSGEVKVADCSDHLLSVHNMNLFHVIVKKQQTIIEQSKIEEAVRVELRQEVEETDREMDVLEYHMRRYCDTDDIEATEFGKENAVDD